MDDKSFISKTQKSERDKIRLGERDWITLLCLVCLVVVLSDLGGTALFEPDEGRAEPRANSYLAMRWRVSAPGYGQIVFAYDEFAEQWKRDEKVLRVFLKEMSLARFSGEIGHSPRTLAKLDEYLLVTNR